MGKRNRLSSSDMFFTSLINWFVITCILFHYYYYIWYLLTHQVQVPLSKIFFRLFRDNNPEQSETLWDDETPMCDCLSEYLQMCIWWYKDSPCPFPNIPYVLPMKQYGWDIHVPCFCYVSNQSKFWVVY